MPEDKIPVLKIDRAVVRETDLQGEADETTRKLYADSLPATVKVETDRGSGTGWFVDKTGRVVTDAHVVMDAAEVKVRTASGDLYRGKVEKLDDTGDLAVINVVGIKPEAVKPLDLGASTALKADQTLYAVGHPFGLRPAYISPGFFKNNVTVEDHLTKRGISALLEIVDRTIAASPKEGADLADFLNQNKLHTRLHIEPGNSGGPLLDGAGKVVGVADFTDLPNRSSSYFTPVERVKAMLEGEGKFDFHYARTAEDWANTYKWQWQNLAPVALLETGAVAGLAAGVAARLPRLGAIGVGAYGALSLYSDAGEYFASHDSRDSWKYGVASASDLVMTAGAVARFIPAVRTVGLVGMGLGLVGQLGSDFIPNRLVLTDITRKDGDVRPPFSVRTMQ